MTEELKNGDKVIALAGAAQSAALVGGGAAGALAGWIAKHSIAIAGAAFAAGAVIGWITGTVVGRFIFPARDGKVMVAKCGPGSLALSLKGNVIASFVSALAVCIFAVFLLQADLKAIAVPTVGTSVAIGVIFAIAVSLT